MSADPNDVTPARAYMLAQHAVHVQGGYSDPDREAERARQQLAQTPGSIDWDRMQAEVDAALVGADLLAKASAAAPAAPVPSAPVTIDLDLLDESSRIVQLYAAYPQAKADAEAASERLKSITDGIKAELGSAMASTTVEKITLRGSAGAPLRLARQVTRRFATRRFQAEHPDIYESYREPSESWVLTAVKAGE